MRANPIAKKQWGFILVVGLLLPLLPAMAEVANSQEITTLVETTQIKNTTLGTARDWNLTESEWQRYQLLMQGANGLWYSKLSPPAILGMNAETREEQKHFAKIAAQQEHDKIAKELAFNQALYVALRELYADEPLIRAFDVTPFSPITHGSR